MRWRGKKQLWRLFGYTVYTEVTENMYFLLACYSCVYVPEIFYMLMALFMTEASAFCIAIVEF